MGHAHIGVCLGLVIAVVAAGYGRVLVAGEAVATVGGRGYLIQNASLVLTMDPNLGDRSILGQLENGDVLIVGDQIAAVGVKLSAPSGVKVIDGRGMVVMPGFVDTHDHLWQSLIRGCAADDDLNGWLNRCVFPFNTSPFSETDAYAGVRLSATGLIDTGVTTAVDWSHAFNPGFVRGNLRALTDSKMRFVFAMFGAQSDGSDIIAAKQEFIDDNPLATLQVATHPAPFLATHVEDMTAVAQLLGVKLHVHLLEDISQVGEDPLGVLQAAGALALGRDLYTAHSIHLGDGNIETLKTLNAAVSHQPLSNMRLASGIMRYPDIQEAGLRIGLGLDGGTNDTTDAFNNMRAAVGLQRATSRDAAPVAHRGRGASRGHPGRRRSAGHAAQDRLADPGQAGRPYRDRTTRAQLRSAAPPRQPDRLQRPAAERQVGVRGRPRTQGERQGNGREPRRVAQGCPGREQPHQAVHPAVTTSKIPLILLFSGLRNTTRD